MKYYQLNKKSFKDLGVTTHKELWEKLKEDHKGLRIGVLTEFEEKKVEDDKPKRYGVMLSTDSEDRHGDIVEQNWSLKNFKNNPVVLDSHNYNSIFHILGTMPKIGKKDGNLRGEIEFNTVSFEGFMAEKMVEKGFVSAGSVGFIPLEFDDKGNITKSELLEFSLVSVPANPEALFEKALEIKETKATPEPTEPEEISDEPKDPSPTPPPKEEEKTAENSPEKGREVKNKRREAVLRVACKQQERRKQLLKESLVVMRQLSVEDNSQKRKQMVNRAIRQLLKVKD